MKLYLDTANIKEIEEGASLGLIDGVTTNPSLVAKEGGSFKDMLLEICRLVDGPISALIMEGLRATKVLAAEGIRVNVTLCFSPTQALLAAKAGAWCVCPFIGHLDDVSRTAWNSFDRFRVFMTTMSLIHRCSWQASGLLNKSLSPHSRAAIFARCRIPSFNNS